MTSNFLLVTVHLSYLSVTTYGRFPIWFGIMLSESIAQCLKKKTDRSRYTTLLESTEITLELCMKVIGRDTSSVKFRF
ncbi:hypothetical protein DFJ43DRAFT_58658 [Lentinula guzmanii]|uniref:Uncharacterized protein n=1 Tax=Lentinula guzmanii TaxID=2804957 RepID=A0AA38JF99_9AGAR|nr:hypothetical protein DFJ43DRAFT_58658 [Lentinula guzmanii]